MPVAQTAARLTDFARRGAGTDAERRAALWLRSETESARRESTIETFWCRPSWALAHGWHALLAIAGSLVMVSDARLGGVLVLVALVSLFADWLTGRSLGRRLTPERASQNVLSKPAATGAPRAEPAGEPIRLIVTANYDAGRTGRAYRGSPRAAATLARGVSGDARLTPGWLGWLVIADLGLLAAAVLRETSAGTPGAGVTILQLIPTVALVLALALLLELAASDFGPAACDNAAGTAVAIALVGALDAAPPRRLIVELVLQGAGDGEAIGLARHLRGRRSELSSHNTVVLGIGPVGGDRLRWWNADGPLAPLRYHRGLRALAQGIAPALDARAYRGRGTSPALPGRARGLPAINLGCLDEDGRAPRSHRSDDRSEALPASALDDLLQFALMFVDALDADLASGPAAPPAAPHDAPASAAGAAHL